MTLHMLYTFAFGSKWIERIVSPVVSAILWRKFLKNQFEAKRFLWSNRTQKMFDRADQELSNGVQQLQSSSRLTDTVASVVG